MALESGILIELNDALCGRNNVGWMAQLLSENLQMRGRLKEIVFEEIEVHGVHEELQVHAHYVAGLYAALFSVLRPGVESRSNSARPSLRSHPRKWKKRIEEFRSPTTRRDSCASSLHLE